MKFEAEQFTFPFQKQFYLGDRVIVTPWHDDTFKQFYGVVQNVCKDGHVLMVASMDGEQVFDGAVYAKQCRLATTLDLI